MDDDINTEEWLDRIVAAAYAVKLDAKFWELRDLIVERYCYDPEEIATIAVSILAQTMDEP